MANPRVDTATQRPTTGLDRGARELMLRVVDEEAGAGPLAIASALFRDRFGGPGDYLEALERVWGSSTRRRAEEAASSARMEAEFPSDFRPSRPVEPAIARALLMTAPEPDFRLAIGETLRRAARMAAAAARLSQICRARGAPWAFSDPGGFEYVGDEEVERELIRPALAAINRPEFSGGVKDEFEQARQELATGTPQSHRQAVHEAGSAVESAMKVVLDHHSVAYTPSDTAAPLFEKLVTQGIVPRHMQSLVLVAMTPRNRRGGHGAGAAPHSVDASEAEAIVAGAAGAISYLAAQLP